MVTLAMPLSAQEKAKKDSLRKERTIALYGHVKNSLTRVGIPDVLITLMREDSTVVDTMHVFKQWSGRGKDDYAYRLRFLPVSNSTLSVLSTPTMRPPTSTTLCATSPATITSMPRGIICVAVWPRRKRPWTR